MTKIIQQPAVWLLLLLAGVSQLSETVYTPSLPAIAHALHTTPAMVEYTLTIYLFGFALGTLFFGKLSDRLGRKPCVVAGLLVFIVGCIGCYYSHSITELMLSRLVQAFGASIGSVLSQAIARDAFHGSALGKVYSSIGSSLAIFPIIGPILGAFIAEHFGWASIFLVLILFGFFLTGLVVTRLSETHHKEHRNPVSIVNVAGKLFRDKKVIGFALIVGGCNGISFSYFAEGSFYLIKLLGLSPINYGRTFMMMALGGFLGGLFSRKLHNTHHGKTIIGYGLWIIFGAALFFAITIVLQTSLPIPRGLLLSIILVSQMVMSFGYCLAASNSMALALGDYKWCVGTASSLFGFFYYLIISLFTFGMGSLHNGTLLPMPLYFLAISVMMLLVKRVFL